MPWCARSSKTWNSAIFPQVLKMRVGGGTDIGVGVGRTVGVAVGRAVGVGVGRELGGAVAVGVGRAVGLALGPAVGDAAAEALACGVGRIDGGGVCVRIADALGDGGRAPTAMGSGVGVAGFPIRGPKFPGRLDDEPPPPQPAKNSVPISAQVKAPVWMLEKVKATIILTT